MSADHDYGPCVQLFLREERFSTVAVDIMQALDRSLPASFEGRAVRYPTNVRPPAGHADKGVLGSYHGVELYTVSAWCDQFPGRQFAAELTASEWLSYSEQMFLTVTTGAVFRDDIGGLSALRTRLAYFPRDVWLYKLAAQWGRIAEERAYVGRTGDVGDELGSRVIAARMVGNIMRLAMLIERRYSPYPKWFGTAFSRLDCAPDLTPFLERVMMAQNWQEREAGLLEACHFMAELQIAKSVPGALAPAVGSLHARPYRFIDSLKIIDALRAAIEDDDVRQLPESGAADQFLSSNYVLAVPAYASAATIALLNTTLGRGRN
ncbi:DUF4037 domain-containing protein [Mesorhizobium sp. M0923]|uniref:DUF4037 domain-containing protein n=1 Tax=unclassified Mesorhizobium TaxID=325217 RepID=UPI0003CFCFF0|nr:DUF4037 domain-containing protein [Mesorhizobium sp. L48C026A00]ESZ11310.1 hypothetical protein X737_30050 [Mesorhizobium sp. L48C026A00]